MSDTNLNLTLLDLIDAIKNDSELSAMHCVDIFNASEFENPELYCDTIFNLQPISPLLIQVLKSLNITKLRHDIVWKIEFTYYLLNEPNEVKLIVESYVQNQEKFKELSNEQITLLISSCVRYNYYNLLEQIRQLME